MRTVGNSLLSEHGRGFKEVDRSRDQHLTASNMKREGCGDHFNFMGKNLNGHLKAVSGKTGSLLP